MKRTARETKESARRITRRGLLLGISQLAFAGLLASRMHFLQVKEGTKHSLLAEENRIKFKLIPPARGRIFDRNGTVIADNEPTYRITLIREDAGDVEEVIGRLSQLVELDEDDLNRALTAMKRTPSFLPVTVADRVEWSDISRVAVNAPALPGITPEVGLSRIYPKSDLYAHVVGYVGLVRQKDLEAYQDPPAVLRVPRFRIGHLGVEAEREDLLRGKSGTKQVEVNAIGREMRELSRKEGQAGADLQLTVDSELQDYALARLGSESASAVVIDLEEGDVLAIASAPSYDPNKFVQGISNAEFQPLLTNDHRPLASKTVQDGYAPASTFKMITMLAGLESRLITPDETVKCLGKVEIGSREFRCWNRYGHGNMNMEQALRESCDVYYYDLALKVGIEQIAEMARKLGLGVAPDVPMSAVTSGLVPDKAWKKRKHKADWVIGDSVNASIGQGFLLASPLQLGVMTARLATGRLVSPRLIRSVDGVAAPSGIGPELDINPNHLRLVHKAMYSVVNNRQGTAYGSRIIDETNRMAGKTGTAQVTSKVIDNKTAPWEQRDHALFVNFAPYDAPRIAVSVVVEQGGGGSSAAAPIARDITLQALYKGDPPLSAYPTKDRSKIKAQQDRLARERAQRAATRDTRA
jgi:penicillin-binding protein 2